MIQSHKDLIVWQKSITLVTEIYLLTKNFPKEEMFGLTSQIRRTAVSIPANIAEGRNRGSKRDFRHFLLIAFASANELETHLLIAKNLSYTTENEFSSTTVATTEICKMLSTMINKLSEPSS